MPSPTSALAQQRPDLETFFEASFASAQMDYVGPRVFPVMTVPKQTGKFGKIAVEDLLRHSQTGARTPGSGYWRDIQQFTEDSYATEEYGFEELIDDREAEMYSDYFDAEVLATQRAVNKLLTRQEMRCAALFDSTAYTAASMTEALGAGAWDVATSTPITDVDKAVTKVYNATGERPNVLIINWVTYRALKFVTQVQNAIESSGAGSSRLLRDVTSAMLSAAFDLEVVVAGGSQNTAGPTAAATIAQIWPKHAIIAKVATTNDMREPCVGRQFHWTDDGSAFSGRVESYRQEENRSNVIRVRHDVDEKQLYLQMACMILNVTS